MAVYDNKGRMIKSSGRKNIRPIQSMAKDTRPIDDHLVNEIILFAVNDSDLYHSRTVPIIDNLRKKIKKGVYDKEKALVLWEHLAEDAAKVWDKKWGTGQGSLKMFSKATRRKAAEKLADRYEENLFWED